MTERNESIMKKEDLIALGLSEEQATKVMELHTSALDGNYVPKSRFNEVNEENKTLKNQVSDRDKQIDGLKKSAGDNEDLKKQIETLQADNKAKDEAHAKELKQLRVDAAVEKALSDSGALNLTATKALLKDLDKAELSDDGSVKGLKEQIEALKGADDTKFLFKVDEQQGKQQFTGFQPGTSTTVPNSKQASYEARLAEARKNNNQLEVIAIKQEAFNDGGLVLN